MSSLYVVVYESTKNVPKRQVARVVNHVGDDNIEVQLGDGNLVLVPRDEAVVLSGVNILQKNYKEHLAGKVFYDFAESAVDGLLKVVDQTGEAYYIPEDLLDWRDK